MTQEMEFCGTICRAAQRLGIRIQVINGHMNWVDFQTGVIIKGSEKHEKPEQLKESCDNLVKYLNPEKNESNKA